MRTLHTYTLTVVALLFGGPPVFCQTKKDIIAAQSVALESISSICELQHELILKAQVKIEELLAQNADLKKKHTRSEVRNDTLSKQLARQKELTYVAQVSRPFIGTPTKDPANGLLDRREALIHFSSTDRLDRVVVETNGVDLLTAVTTLRIFDPDGRQLYEQALETTDMDELDLTTELQRCIVSHRLSNLLSQQTLVPIARDRNSDWWVLSPDLITEIPGTQCGVLVHLNLDDPQPILIVYDRTNHRVSRIREPRRQ